MLRPRPGARAAHAARRRNRRGEGERLRTSLVEAAIALLGETGDLDDVSVRAVTARAGVSPTALYLHFADRDGLLRAVKARCFAELREYCEALAGPDTAETDPRERLAALGRAYLSFAQEHPGHYRILFSTRVPALPWSGDLADAPPERIGAFLDLVRAVSRCHAAAADRSPDVEVAKMLWAGMHGYAALRPVMPSFPLPAPADYIARLLDAHLPAR